MNTVAAKRDFRWIGALGLALVVVAINWVIARPDALSATTILRRYAGSPLPAEIAFMVSFVLLGVIPAIVAKPLLGKGPSDLGLGLGDSKVGLTWVAIGLPIAIAAGFIGASSPAIASEYPLGDGLSRSATVFLPYVIGYGIYYLGFEYLYRGYLLLGLSSRLGALQANLLQATLATAAHIGKPPVELISAFPASLAFGWLTLRTGSIWYAFAIHWVVGVILDWLLLGMS